MDILENIAALVTDRSLGEIKLNALSVQPVLKAGDTIDVTRLTADLIKKNFALKTDSERAIPNALFHDVLGYMPVSDPTLKLKKEEYESKLYKSEMHKIEPPWTLNELIDEIAVDLARAPPVKPPPKEASGADRPPVVLGPNTKCGNCGVVGKHLSKNCPINCKSCGNNYCPGARLQLCAIACDIQPSKRDLMSAIEGIPLHPYIVGKLDKQWATKHGKELSMLEMAVAVVEDDNDDEDEDVCATIGLINPAAAELLGKC